MEHKKPPEQAFNLAEHEPREPTVIYERLECSTGYPDEADLFTAIQQCLQAHGIENTHLLFTGYGLQNDATAKTETYAVGAGEYGSMLERGETATPLWFIIDGDGQGTPTIDVYNEERLLEDKTNAGHYHAPPNKTIEHALVARFDVSAWLY